MYWKSEEGGERTIELYGPDAIVFCTITEDADNYIFNLEGAPADFRIAKLEIPDPIQWASNLIGIDIKDMQIEISEQNEETPGPFLSFVDDENKAIWQVWDVE